MRRGHHKTAEETPETANRPLKIFPMYLDSVAIWQDFLSYDVTPFNFHPDSTESPNLPPSKLFL